MARIAGVNIPDNKHIVISLTYIYGIGRSVAKEICNKLGVSQDTKVSNLQEDKLNELRSILLNYTV
jgi:small subunit ribosomal protein S13